MKTILFTFAWDDFRAREVLASARVKLANLGYDTLSPLEMKPDAEPTHVTSDLIKRAAVVIAFVNERSSNVLFDIGYAYGVGKTVILISDVSTNLPFDLRSVVSIDSRSAPSEIAFEIVRQVDRLESWQPEVELPNNLHDMLSIRSERPELFELVREEAFVRAISDEFLAQGFEVEPVHDVQEYGFDLRVRDRAQESTLIEVKKRNPNSKVSISSVQQLLGASHAYEDGMAVLICTSGFTDSAREFAARQSPRIQLWTLNELEEFTKRRNPTGLIGALVRNQINATEADVRSRPSLVITENPRDLFVKGTQSVLRRIGKAFGPAGAHFSVSVGNREPMPYKQGSSIVQGIRGTNPLEGRGVREMQLVAQEVQGLVGDGTKTAILLTQALIEQGHKALKHEFLHRDVILGMEKAVNHSLDLLRSLARPVGTEQVQRIAATAAMDSSIGNLVSKAVECVGKDGVLTIENSTTTDTSLEVVEGMQLDRGFLSDQFITNHKTNEVLLENPYILIHERRISSMRDLLPILEQIAVEKEPLLLIAEDVEGEALSTLIINQVRGTLKVAAIKAPGTGDRRRAVLDDIATLTGAKLISPDLGLALENVRLSDLGRAKSVTIDKDFTTIVEGAGGQDEIEGRIQSLRAQIEAVASPYDREKLQERLARLVGRLAVIRIGGVSEIEVIDRRYRSESAMHSVRSALEEGWLPGGGITLFQACETLKNLSSENDAQSAGLLAVAQALERPIHHLVVNAQASTEQVVREMHKYTEPSMGFNVSTKQVEDLVAAGVIDSAKMLRIVLEVAFAHAKLVLQTDDWELDPTPRAQSD